MKWKHFAGLIPAELVEAFGAECRRQGRKRAIVQARLVQWFVSLPPDEREKICSGSAEGQS